MKKIHPAFKQFILNEATKKWDKILRETSNKNIGINSGVCFSTSNAFCQVFDNLGIPCKIEIVESLIGNNKTKELYDYYSKQGDLDAFFKHIELVIAEKGKNNLTGEDPVIMGLGVGQREDQFHVIMNLPEQNEAIDLTIGHIKREKWDVDCNNYWAKYSRRGYKEGIFYSENDEIWKRSGCILITKKKITPARIGIKPDINKKQINMLREYIRDEIKKRKIPIFIGR